MLPKAASENSPVRDIFDRWEKRLPEEVRRAAPPGSACPLFWPPARVGAAEAVSGSNLEAGLWSHIRQWPAIRAVRLAVRVSQRMLLTMDPIAHTFSLITLTLLHFT